MFNDLRYAFRQLLKNPGFTTVAVLTLALGIGATTAVFSVVYAVVLRPLPFPESEQFVALWTQTPRFERLPMAAANHRDLKTQNTVFEDIAILSALANYNLTGDGEPERLLASRIPANLFPLLRVRPALGRGFTEDENQSGQDRLVIRLAITGIALGVIGAMAPTGFLRGLLFGVSPADPVTFIVVPLLLVLVALLACWVPARRAANVDPMEALRSE